jgi:hypothetical protein
MCPKRQTIRIMTLASSQEHNHHEFMEKERLREKKKGYEEPKVWSGYLRYHCIIKTALLDPHACAVSFQIKMQYLGVDISFPLLLGWDRVYIKPSFVSTSFAIIPLPL